VAGAKPLATTCTRNTPVFFSFSAAPLPPTPDAVLLALLSVQLVPHRLRTNPSHTPTRRKKFLFFPEKGEGERERKLYSSFLYCPAADTKAGAGRRRRARPSAELKLRKGDSQAAALHRIGRQKALPPRRFGSWRALLQPLVALPLLRWCAHCAA
jgi:hypothetical protein